MFSSLGARGGGVGESSTSEGYHDSCGGYHAYIGGCSVHRRDTMNTSGDIMIHTGEQLIKAFDLY